MKRLLGRHSAQRTIGLLVGAQEVTMSVLAMTPLGRLELARESELRGLESLDELLGRMLDPWLELKPRVKVVIGLPEVRVFHSARPIAAVNRKAPELWLHDALQTQGIRVEDMTIDMVEASIGKRVMAGLVACRRRSLAEPMEALARRSARLVRVEPMPCALLRAAAAQLKPPWSSKLAARFVLGDRKALGLLVAGGLPLHWRVFDLPPGDEPTALLAALIALKMHARSWRVEADVDAVLIHGRPDLAPRLDPAGLAARLGIRVLRADEPGFDPASIAIGLALGGLDEARGFDLARTIKPLETIREIFPWGELMMQSAVLAGVLLLTSERARSLEASQAATAASLAKFRWLGVRTEADLEKERKVLEQKDKTAEKFLASRVSWSSQLNEVASRLPARTRLISLQGIGELENLDGKAALGPGKKTFVLRLETPVPPTGETPCEIDGLLESLRDKSPVRQEFPVIELKDLKTVRSTGKDGGAVASYSIVCLPTPFKAPSKPVAAKK
jgi:hypothetical protein